MYKRTEIEELKKRVHESRKHIQVIMGPRQVGKTTMVRQLFEDLEMPYLFTSADAVGSNDGVWLEQTWELARLKMRTS
ncbi:MAG TPA: AAA family ATPase, partial [Bacteroidales bacterium]|nr:AAA family ATPase [Bacteroidales bacterium]